MILESPRSFSTSGKLHKVISAALVGLCYALLANYATRMVQNGIDFSIMPVRAFPIPPILLSMVLRVCGATPRSIQQR